MLTHFYIAQTLPDEEPSQQIVRVCPDFWESTGWRDWVNVDWGEGHPIPCHLLAILDLRHLPALVSLELDGSVVTGPGLYLVGESIRQSLYDTPNDKDKEYKNFLCHQSSRLCRWAQKDVTVEHVSRTVKTVMTKLCIFPIESVESPCIAAQDSTDHLPHGYIFLEPRHTWPQHFLANAKEYNKKKTAS